jgi:hypothetical protein
MSSTPILLTEQCYSIALKQSVPFIIFEIELYIQLPVNSVHFIKIPKSVETNNKNYYIIQTEESDNNFIYQPRSLIDADYSCDPLFCIVNYSSDASKLGYKLKIRLHKFRVEMPPVYNTNQTTEGTDFFNLPNLACQRKRSTDFFYSQDNRLAKIHQFKITTAGANSIDLMFVKDYNLLPRGTLEIIVEGMFMKREYMDTNGYILRSRYGRQGVALNCMPVCSPQKDSIMRFILYNNSNNNVFLGRRFISWIPPSQCQSKLTDCFVCKCCYIKIGKSRDEKEYELYTIPDRVRDAGRVALAINGDIRACLYGLAEGDISASNANNMIFK